MSSPVPNRSATNIFQPEMILLISRHTDCPLDRSLELSPNEKRSYRSVEIALRTPEAGTTVEVSSVMTFWIKLAQ